MSTAEKKLRYTLKEYLDLEKQANYRSEYYKGEIFAISGGSGDHSLIASNVNREMGTSLKGSDCFVYTSDLKVRIEAADSVAYPDVMVICGPREHYQDRKDIVTNPKVVVEVLSKGTAAWDRGGKFRNYEQISTITEYILIEQTAAQVDIFSRTGTDPWILERYDGLDAQVKIKSLGISLPLNEIYYGVQFLES